MKKAPRPLQKHTLNLYEGDFAELGDLFPEVDTSVLIREVIQDLIARTKAGDPKPQLSLEVMLPT